MDYRLHRKDHKYNSSVEVSNNAIFRLALYNN